MRRFHSRGQPPSVYWIKSLVPMDIKSTSLASQSEMMAAEGVSIIMPDFHFRIEGHVLRLSSPLSLREELVRLPDFVQTRDHGIHDLELAFNGSAQDRAQLGFENIREAQAKPDPTQAQKRILFRSEAGHTQRRQLVAPQIHRAENHRIRKHLACDGRIILILLFFARQVLAVQIEKFRPIEADPLGAVLRALCGFLLGIRCWRQVPLAVRLLV